ncbi:Ig-like domain-containing protein [Staphylococcus hyicus]|nr:Ig-like domain-containing protein [Staphylococcus hyicus]MCO4330178.1 Ig-like domain-containing protein [Staphylococcus hyicus]
MDHKKQIFSIRKCTLGVGSFLIGSFIFFSFAPMQVEAAESTVSSSIQNTDIKSTESGAESNEAPTEKAVDPSAESNEAPTEETQPNVDKQSAPTEGTQSNVDKQSAPTEETQPNVDKQSAPTEETRNKITFTQLDTVANKEISYEDVENTSNKINNEKSNRIATTRSKRSVENTSPRLVGAVGEENSATDGRDVSAEVNPKFKFSDLKWDASDDETVASNATKPEKHRYLDMNFTIPGDVKAGDYFKIKLPNEVSPVLADTENGLSLGRDKIYANATYDSNENSYTIKFTEEAENYRNYKYNFKSKLKANRDIVRNNGEYNLEYQVGDKKFVDNVSLEYHVTPKRAKTIVSGLQYVKNEGNKYKYKVNYTINSLQKPLEDAKVGITRHSNPEDKKSNNVTKIISPEDVKIYEVEDINTLNDSSSLEGVRYKEVTSDFKPTISDDKETLIYDLKNTNKTYIFSVEGENDQPLDEGYRLEGQAEITTPSNEKTRYYDFIYNKVAPTSNDDLGEKITPPEVDNIPDQEEVEVGTPIKDIVINGKDNGGGPLTHEVTGLPEGVTFDPETNTIKGTPTKSGEYPVTVTTTDKDGNKTETKFKLFVVNPTNPDDGDTGGNDNADGEGGSNDADGKDDANNTDGNDGTNSNDNIHDDASGSGTKNHLNSEKDTTVTNSTQSSSENDKDSKSALPETGQENASPSLLGTMIAGIGSLFFFRRKKRNNE